LSNSSSVTAAGRGRERGTHGTRNSCGDERGDFRLGDSDVMDGARTRQLRHHATRNQTATTMTANLVDSCSISVAKTTDRGRVNGVWCSPPTHPLSRAANVWRARE